MKTFQVTAVVAGLFVVSTLVAFAAEKEGKKEKKPPTVKELMEAAHGKPKKGEKPSPLSVVRAQVALEKPDWELLAKNTAPLHRLAEAVKDKEFGYRAPGSTYAKPVAALMLATKKHDLAAAREAVGRLDKSCAGCHRGYK